MSQSVDCYLEKHDRVWLCHVSCSKGASQSVDGYLEKYDRVWSCHVTCSGGASESVCRLLFGEA